MNEQLQRVADKLALLGGVDRDYRVFGSSTHKYRLNPKASLRRVQQFQQIHNIILPKDYVDFITNIGDGGAGPYYGIEPLEVTLYNDLDYRRPDSLLCPSKPFPHTEPWNLTFNATVDVEEDEEEYYQQLSVFEEIYYNNEHANGVIAICNYGCAVSLYLVVNGAEHGNIWTNDRASDQGIYPSREFGNTDRITFLQWYELWLDDSLNKLGRQFLPRHAQMSIPPHVEEKSQKPWWKIW